MLVMLPEGGTGIIDDFGGLIIIDYDDDCDNDDGVDNSDLPWLGWGHIRSKAT